MLNNVKELEKMPLTTFALHLLAMAFMLCDHMWATVIQGQMWLTFVGRLAFPIFAFMLVEGFFHTRNFKKYILRLLIAAVISEIPFNLMYGGEIFYPFHQNVMWTLMLCLFGLWLIEKARKTGKIWLFLLTSFLVVAFSYFFSIIAMLDCNGFGVLTVFMFYFLRGRNVICFALQAIFMYIINARIFKGMTYDVTIFGQTYEILQQAVAVFALIPIWLYNGKQGPHNKVIQYSFYAFYPLHMLILSLIALYK